MRRYLLRRALVAPLILLGVLTVTFLIVHAAPGSAFTLDQAATLDPRAAAQLRRVFGADDPLPVGYAHWLAAFLTGDLGVSLTYRRPVSQVLQAALPPTLLLSSTALALSVLAGVGAACAASLAPGRLIDRAITTASLALYAAPPFWLGMLLMMTLSAALGWLPASGIHDVDADHLGMWARFIDLLRHLSLPCLTLAAPGSAAIALMVRAEIGEAVLSDEARAARARGATAARVVLRHALRRAIAPAATLVGLGLPGLVSGSLVIEVLFAWPGMGRITYEAILARDTPVVAGAVALAATVTLAGSLLADLIYAWADPRVRLPAREARLGPSR